VTLYRERGDIHEAEIAGTITGRKRDEAKGRSVPSDSGQARF